MTAPGLPWWWPVAQRATALLEARVRQDYYQIQWPWRSRRYEYGVYVDEVFSCYFTPAFAAIINKNPVSGSFSF